MFGLVWGKKIQAHSASIRLHQTQRGMIVNFEFSKFFIEIQSFLFKKYKKETSKWIHWGGKNEIKPQITNGIKNDVKIGQV